MHGEGVYQGFHIVLVMHYRGIMFMAGKVLPHFVYLILQLISTPHTYKKHTIFT